MSVLHRLDSHRNMARFYAVSVEPSLFGDYLLIRIWGRIGKQGHTRFDWYDNKTDAEAAGAQIAESKRRRGYSDVVAKRGDV